MDTIEKLAQKAFDIYYNGGEFTTLEIQTFNSLMENPNQLNTGEVEAIQIMIDRQQQPTLLFDSTTPNIYTQPTTTASYSPSIYSTHTIIPCHQPTTVYTHPNGGELVLSSEKLVYNWDRLGEMDVLVSLGSLSGKIWKVWDGEVLYVDKYSCH